MIKKVKLILRIGFESIYLILLKIGPFWKLVRDLFVQGHSLGVDIVDDDVIGLVHDEKVGGDGDDVEVVDVDDAILV